MSSICRTGETVMDFLTGREVPDSDDEQIRQKIERLLVEGKGFDPSEIEVDRCFEISLGDQKAAGRAELVVYVQGRPFMSFKCSRGSLVTREREALAASRLACDVQIPLTVVTNGRDAEVLDTLNGRISAVGLEAVPSKEEAEKRSGEFESVGLSEKRKEKEARIYLAFADFACPTECNE